MTTADFSADAEILRIVQVSDTHVSDKLAYLLTKLPQRSLARGTINACARSDLQVQECGH